MIKLKVKTSNAINARRALKFEPILQTCNNTPGNPPLSLKKISTLFQIVWDKKIRNPKGTHSANVDAVPLGKKLCVAPTDTGGQSKAEQRLGNTRAAYTRGKAALHDCVRTRVSKLVSVCVYICMCVCVCVCMYTC